MKLHRPLYLAGLLYALLSGCAQNLGAQRCDDVLLIDGGPQEVPQLITHTCQRYARATGASFTEIRQALAGTHIYFFNEPHLKHCSDAPGCVHLTATTAYIYTSTGDWQRILPHELVHILLARQEPELPRKYHHLRMRQLGL